MENMEEKIDGLSNALQDYKAEEHEYETENPKRFLGKMSIPDTIRVIEAVMDDMKLATAGITFIYIAAVLQTGGSNANAIEQVSFTYKGKTLTAKRLSSIMSRIDRNFKPRKFARTMANEIYKVSLSLGIDGDLAKRRADEVGHQSLEERVWCSNFQTGNPDCLPQVRKWLVDNYNKRFPSTSR